MTGDTITGNSATNHGGGLYNLGTLTLTDCTVTGNSATIDGGGLDIAGGTATLIDCTVTGNSARYGGGVRTYESSLSLTNTIVAGNSNGSGPSDILANGSVSGSHNLIGTGGSGGLQNGANHNLVGLTNPGLAPLGDYGGPTQTIALLPGSPAINAGEAGADIPTADQRGEPRVGAPDIGAFESQGFTLTIVPASSPQQAHVGTAFTNPLTVIVTSKNPVEPVAGGIVTFAAPAVGPSAELSPGDTVTIGANGRASVIATANAIAGAYAVIASTAGGNAVAFDLTNTEATAGGNVALGGTLSLKASTPAALNQGVQPSRGGSSALYEDAVDQVLGALADDIMTGIQINALTKERVGPGSPRNLGAQDASQG
jgi:hypothetical protein